MLRRYACVLRRKSDILNTHLASHIHYNVDCNRQLFESLSRPNLYICRRFTVDFRCDIAHSSIWCPAMFACFPASRLKSEVGHFNCPWCIIVWYTFLQNFVSSYGFIEVLQHWPRRSGNYGTPCSVFARTVSSTTTTKFYTVAHLLKRRVLGVSGATSTWEISGPL